MDLMRNIEVIVCEDKNISPETLHTKSRNRKITEAKHIIIYLSDYFAKRKLSYRQLAEYFKLNHTTAIYAVKKIDNYQKIYSTYALLLNQYKEKITILNEKNTEIKKNILEVKNRIHHSLINNTIINLDDVLKYNNLSIRQFSFINSNVLKSNENYEIIEEKL